MCYLWELFTLQLPNCYPFRREVFVHLVETYPTHVLIYLARNSRGALCRFFKALSSYSSFLSVICLRNSSSSFSLSESLYLQLSSTRPLCSVLLPIPYAAVWMIVPQAGNYNIVLIDLLSSGDHSFAWTVLHCLATIVSYILSSFLTSVGGKVW